MNQMMNPMMMNQNINLFNQNNLIIQNMVNFMMMNNQFSINNNMNNNNFKNNFNYNNENTVFVYNQKEFSNNINENNGKLNNGIANINTNQSEEKSISDINIKINKNEKREKTKDDKSNINKEENLDNELKFKSIKEELNNMVDDILKKNLSNKKYEGGNAQNWINNISDEVIEKINQKKYGFKFICCGTIIQKGDCSLNYSTITLSKPDYDGLLLVKYENEDFHCFINLFGVSAY